MAGKGLRHSYRADINLIRNNLRDHYQNGFPVLKELIQNADDASATRMDIGISSGIANSTHPLLRGPALFVANNGPFTESNEHAIRTFGLSDKPNQESAIGKFGLGLKSVFHLCEAFFYLSPNEGLPGDILNPWSGEDDSAHPEWDLDFDETDRASIVKSLKDVLVPNDWFCLWIPLRQRRQYEPKLPIIPNPIGDTEDPADEIFVPDLDRHLSAIMPMLHWLKVIRAQEEPILLRP